MRFYCIYQQCKARTLIYMLMCSKLQLIKFGKSYEFFCLFLPILFNVIKQLHPSSQPVLSALGNVSKIAKVLATFPSPSSIHHHPLWDAYRFFTCTVFYFFSFAVKFNNCQPASMCSLSSFLYYCSLHWEIKHTFVQQVDTN